MTTTEGDEKLITAEIAVTNNNADREEYTLGQPVEILVAENVWLSGSIRFICADYFSISIEYEEARLYELRILVYFDNLQSIRIKN